MDRTERFHLIDQMLCNQRVVNRAQFLETLEVSPATFKRDLEYLRDRLMAPIVWDRERRGYCYQQTDGDTQFQLPGLWFNTSEIQALLSMDSICFSRRNSKLTMRRGGGPGMSLSKRLRSSLSGTSSG